jgi:hypothetical protein
MAACEFALNVAYSSSLDLSEIVDKLKGGKSLSSKEVEKLERLADELDDKYFKVQDEPETYCELGADALVFFSQARAVSALALWGKGDSLLSSCESIYESMAAVSDGDALVNVVLLSLKDS